MSEEPLRSQLQAISEITRADLRGKALEPFVATLFRQHHFEVTLNPGIARPRQTDVFAAKGNDTFLIECKWRKAKADINDIDNLRSRLRRTDGSVVGVLVSVPGFTGSVLSDVQHHREQPVLLISGEELQLAATGLEPLSSLLWRKQRALRVDGNVLLDEPRGKRAAKRQPAQLPTAASQFMLPGGERSHVMECAGQFGQFVFSHELPDIDWVPASGLGVTLDVAATVLDQRGLLVLVDKLADLGWATRDACWSVQQATRNWHGLGCAAFAEELPRWQRRAATPAAHHSEEICYLDRCDGGFYTLTANIAAHETRRATSVVLSFQLQGIPLDSGPLLQLCRSVDVHDGLYFRPRKDKSVSRRPRGNALVDDVQPVGYLTTSEQDTDGPATEWVTGIVIANPFRKEWISEPASNALDGLELLRPSEQLVCSLAEHHIQDGATYSYFLQGFEYARTSEATVCRPVANWKLG